MAAEQDLNRYIDEQEKREAREDKHETALFVASVLDQTHFNSEDIIIDSLMLNRDKSKELLSQLMEHFYGHMPNARKLRLERTEAIADIAINIMRAIREGLEELEQ